MNDSTTSSRKVLARQAQQQMKKVISLKQTLHASAEALFFVQLFARACHTKAAF